MPTGAMNVAGKEVSMDPFHLNEALAESMHTFVFLLCQHENGKHQFSSQDSFDEDTLSKTCSFSKCGSHIEACRKQHLDQETRKYASAYLRS
jgi:hypothetical protein